LTPRPLRPPWKLALLAATLVTSLCLVDFFVVRPLQEQGRLDRAAVLVNVAATWISMPGMVGGRLIYIIHHHISPGLLGRYDLAVAGFAGLFWGAVTWLLLIARVRGRARLAASGPRIPRRAAMGRVARWTAVGGVAVLGGYATILEPRRPVVRRFRVPLPGLPAALSPLKVVHLSDLHLGPFVSEAYLRAVVDRVNRLQPDLVLLTGDYVHGSARFIDPVARILGGLRARLGRVGVLGNHDFWEGAPQSRAALRRVAGVTLVDNDRVWIGPRGFTHGPPAAGALVVAGLGDLWEDRTCMDSALGGVDPGTPRLLLAHNPDSAEARDVVRSPHRVDLMLSGHTHGGQVRLPGTRALITPSRYGTKYAHGLVQGPAFPVRVSAGIGTTILPVRFLVPPEIVVLELVRG